jgi:restriction system protein
MQAAVARNDILDHALSISPGQFEQLCRILIRESEKTRELELTPSSGDDGIDVHAVVDRDLFQARLGVQAKRNNEGNTVSSDTMRTFKGSLSEGNYHVGTFVTTSSFTSHAVDSAQKRYIRLINGQRLSEIMLQSELGVIQEGENEYTTDWEFWELFEIERDDLIRSDAVPQADNVDVLNVVLRAINEGHTVKPTITEYMEDKRGESWRPRQADYYAQAAWALGFLHKDTKVEYAGYERQQWTLSRVGREYVEYLSEGDTESSETLLLQQIGEMEIAKRVLRELEQQGSMKHEEVQDIVHENTLPSELDDGLSRDTSDRRGNTVGRWIERLPNVVRHARTGAPSYQLAGSTYEWVNNRLTDY